MAEFVKKPAIGGYKPVTGGLSNSECTHVILTLSRACQGRSIHAFR